MEAAPAAQVPSKLLGVELLILVTAAVTAVYFTTV